MARACRKGLVAVALLMCIVRLEGQQRPGTAPIVDVAVPRLRFPFGIVAFDLNEPVPRVLAQLGTGLVRGSCNWEDLEPARGVFNWNCSDNVIIGAQALQLRSYMTVVCTPHWADNGAGCG